MTTLPALMTLRSFEQLVFFGPQLLTSPTLASIMPLYKACQCAASKPDPVQGFLYQKPPFLPVPRLKLSIHVNHHSSRLSLPESKAVVLNLCHDPFGVSPIRYLHYVSQ